MNGKPGVGRGTVQSILGRRNRVYEVLKAVTSRRMSSMAEGGWVNGKKGWGYVMLDPVDRMGLDVPMTYG